MDSEYFKKYYIKNKDIIDKRSKQYQYKHKDRLKRYMREYMKRYRQAGYSTKYNRLKKTGTLKHKLEPITKEGIKIIYKPVIVEF